MDCCSQPGLMPFEQGKEKLLAALQPILEIETIALNQALGRVVAEPILAAVDVPPMNNSAMDGYAFQFSSFAVGQPLKIVGQALAGHPYTEAVKAGECIRIMTGAMMPEGADTVVMQENVTVEQDQIRIETIPKSMDNVRRKGAAVKNGEQVFEKGRRLTPQDLGLLASLGVAEVQVFRKLNVAVISTGDELKQAGETLEPGQIYESNSVAISAMLKQLGVIVKVYQNVADDPEQIKSVMLEADANCDLIVSSGGVSVGDADYVKDVIESIGNIEFWKLAIKPGKPFTFGRLQNAYFIGLPGNPVSAMVTFYLLGRLAVEKLQNASFTAPIRIKAILQDDLRKKPGRMDFQRGFYSIDASGKVLVQSVGNQGSGIVTSMSKANCFIVLAQEQGHCRAGEEVTIEVFQGCLA